MAAGHTWFVFITAWWDLHGRPLILAVVIPAVAGAIAARSVGLRAAPTSVTSSGLVAGLAVFIGW
jgi:hypothetical protein